MHRRTVVLPRFVHHTRSIISGHFARFVYRQQDQFLPVSSQYRIVSNHYYPFSLFCGVVEIDAAMALDNSISGAADAKTRMRPSAQLRRIASAPAPAQRVPNADVGDRKAQVHSRVRAGQEALSGCIAHGRGGRLADSGLKTRRCINRNQLKFAENSCRYRCGARRRRALPRKPRKGQPVDFSTGWPTPRKPSFIP